MIRGRRVTLRPFTTDDLPSLRRWHDDGEVMRYWGERQPVLTPGTVEAMLQPGGRMTTFGSSGIFCICDETGRAIGRLDYDGRAWNGGERDRRTEIGLFLGEKEAWHRGYGPETIILVLNWLFNHQNVHRVWLTVQANNPRAIRVYEKIGFRREGTLREHNFYDGQWHDEHIYGILAGEFNARYRPDQSEWLVTGEIAESAD